MQTLTSLGRRTSGFVLWSVEEVIKGAASDSLE
jgi:hypothetical protein